MNEELRTFVVKQSAVDDEKITSETQLTNDLGVNGDDGIEFIIAYGKRFNVDISEFRADYYFDPEGDVILPSIIRSVTGKSKPIKRKLTVGHLEKGIIAGKLDAEVISGNIES